MMSYTLLLFCAHAERHIESNRADAVAGDVGADRVRLLLDLLVHGLGFLLQTLDVPFHVSLVCHHLAVISIDFLHLLCAMIDVVL